jgi:hypothetical protein
LDIGDHQRCGETLAGRISNHQPQAVIREPNEIVTIAAEGSNLAAGRARVQEVGGPTQTLHKPLLDVAGKHPVLANINYQFVRRHFYSPTVCRFTTAKIDRWRPDLFLYFFPNRCRE